MIGSEKVLYGQTKMKTKTKTQLHCGACMTDFDTIELLNVHIPQCPAANVMLPFVYKIWFNGDTVGHRISHFIRALHINANLIKRYAYCIADEMNSLDRSKIHSELCKKLDLNYNDFRPFESSDIKVMPNRKDAEKILWNALQEELLKLSKNTD